ncbi:MAG: hypothetical protein N2448_10190 [Caloramator sp.]|nr:hypothetical protein [Caloramator sp.]
MLFRILLFLASIMFFVTLSFLFLLELGSSNKKSKNKKASKHKNMQNNHWSRNKKHYAK